MNNNKEYYDFTKNAFDRYSPTRGDSFSELFNIAKIKKLNRGEVLLDVGRTSKYIYVLYQGIVVSSFFCKNGEQYHKNIFLEGNFVGSTVSALTNKPSNFELEIIENAILIRFNYDEYKTIINKYTDLKDFYIAYLEKNWIIDKEKREIDIVMKDAYKRYLDFIQSYPDIEKRVPLHYIASHLGITPTQLSRIRKKVKENRSNQHM